MIKIVKYVGLDAHKDSTTIAIADEGRDGNVRLYGKIRNDLKQINKVMRKLISQNSELRCVYEAGPCGYPIYRHLMSQGEYRDIPLVYKLAVKNESIRIPSTLKIPSPASLPC